MRSTPESLGVHETFDIMSSFTDAGRSPFHENNLRDGTLNRVLFRESQQAALKILTKAVPYLDANHRMLLDARLREDEGGAPRRHKDIAQDLGVTVKVVEHMECAVRDVLRASAAYLDYTPYRDMKAQAHSVTFFEAIYREMCDGVIEEPELFTDFVRLAHKAKPLIPNRHWQAFRMHHLERKPRSFMEIGRVMDITGDTAKKFCLKAMDVIYATAVSEGRAAAADFAEHIHYPDIFETALVEWRKRRGGGVPQP